MAESRPHVLVIGAGVIGLSSAVLLQAAGFLVTIVARDLPAPSETIDPATHINYASPWAGAHNRWIPPPPPPPPQPLLSPSLTALTVESGPQRDARRQLEREHALALRTFARMRGLCGAHPEAGITLVRGAEHVEAGPGAAEYAAALTEERAVRELGMSGFRLLRADELERAGCAWGCEYDTWCLSPMVYCCFLLRKFVCGGGGSGRVVRRELRSLEEAFALADTEALGGRAVDAVVNASGIGFGDENVFVTRGQTCLVAKACAVTVTRQHADGSWTFCIPRGFDGGTVIGGTKEPHDWGAEPRAETREALLARFAAAYPQMLEPQAWPAISFGAGSEGNNEEKTLSAATAPATNTAGVGEMPVLRDIVGRRPTRKGGLRLEGEMMAKDKFVMHAYGLGGRGFELSWGVAEEVVEGVSKYCRLWKAGKRGSEVLGVGKL